MKSCRRILLAAVLPALLPFAAAAELKVSLKLEHTSVVQFESVVAFVNIANSYDAPLVLGEGDTNNSLKFIVTKLEQNQVVKRINEAPMTGNVTIKPDDKENVMTEVSLWYEMGKVGRYLVTAVVEKNGREFESNKALLEVVRGIEIASVTKNVPGYEDLVRKYALRYWTREGKEHLFLSVDEEDTGYNYGVFYLGNLVRVYKPRIDVDREGRITIFHQNGGDCYTKTVLKSSRESVKLLDQTYHLEDGKPYPFPKKDVGGKIVAPGKGK